MKQLYTSVVVLIALYASAAFAADLPDVKLTPGAANPLVTQATLGSTICATSVPGKPTWIHNQRPPASYTTKLKIQQLATTYKGSDQNPKDFEEDHLVSIENGGHPRDPKNLWPQHWSDPWGAKKKDRLENAIHRKICSGELTLKQGQDALAHDWIASYKKYVK